MIESLLDVLQGTSAWWILAILAFLPLIGMPLSPIWILAGLKFGFVNGLGVIIAGMAINFALAYFIAQGWMREPITRFLRRRGIEVPDVQRNEFIKLTIAIRLFPALPQFMQSYLLGISNVPFMIYYIFSFPPQIAYAVGFILIGDSLFEMKIGILFLGASALVAVTLILNIIRNRGII